jgi:aminopyrrolnitrin oxygenase
MLNLYENVYPESWYAVLPSRGLKARAIRELDAFGKKLVLFRTASGQPAIMERFCPHMGASLACGKVSGERIICPFHAWELDTGGECVRIPYEAKIPKAARVSAFPVVEHLGWIWMYNGEAPAFRLPEVPEHADRAFSVHHWSRDLDAHALMILENSGDLQHFKYIHRLDFQHVDVEMIREEAHDFEFRVALEGGTGRLFFNGARQRLTFRYVGASFILGTVELNDKLISRFIVAPLPTGPRQTRVHQVVIAKRLRGALRPLNAIYLPILMYYNYRGMEEEYAPIWSKMATDGPRVLVRDDWLQQRFHKYYRSHFPKIAPPAAAAG